jgi:hypothetical protein
MSVRRVTLAALAATTILAGLAQAGGRARVEVSREPDQVKAGEAFEIAITVVPETWNRRRNIEPLVTAMRGEERVVTAAIAEKRANRYWARLALPEPGEWTIRVDSRFCETVMKPVGILAVAEPKAKKTSS